MPLESNQTTLFPSFSLTDWLGQIPPELVYMLAGIVVFVLLIVIALFILRYIFHSEKMYPAVFQKKIFKLTVPQRVKEETEQKKPLAEVIAEVEGLYASLGGLKPHGGFKTWLFGRYDHWSFETILGEDNLITFYMAVPQYLVDYVKQQLFSCYPHLQVEEIEDYNIFNRQGFVACAYLKLAKQNMFPILTYKQMNNTDPLVSAISVLSKFTPGQTGAIQIVLRSAR